MTQPVWITPSGSIGSYPALVTINAGSFVIGEAYTITTIGNTDFTLIGAASNTVGISFVATGTGTGTGTANTSPRITVIVVAQPVLPAITVTYTLISGSLPQELSLSVSGTISGIPTLVTKDTTYSFVIRATDNLGNIRDRTFTMLISGVVNPEFTTPAGNILSERDSTWVAIPIQYSNPVSTNKVSIRVVQGQLPPGLEINETGLIRGYAKPPTLNTNIGLVTTTALATASGTNTITCLSTTGFTVNRPVVFSGNTYGNLVAGQTYFIKEVLSANTFTISTTSNGPVLLLDNGVGNITVTLPDITVGQPTVRTFSFTLRLDSEFGSDVETYSITVRNQNAPITEGGPGLSVNTRIPTIFNTRPATYNITQDTTNFSYYILPDDTGNTYDPNDLAYIGRLSSDNKFSFKILGKDFDGNNLTYEYANLPLGLVGDPVTGWITGNPVISNNNISDFSFRVRVYKTANPTFSSLFFNFSFRITTNIIGDIDWLTPENLGVIENGTLSILNVVAQSDVDLEYRILEGNLPPNLFLLSNGEISGTVAYQPTDTLLPLGSITNFTFTVQAFSPIHSVVQSNRTFTISVEQVYSQPADTLYIKCTPSIDDRKLLKSLLESNSLIPNDFLYRPEDSNFGKATSVTYAHAYGIHANDLDAYVASVMKNHYWRNITLGELKTAVARNNRGEIIYEVVYSQIVDNLVNPEGVSIDEEIVWPRTIDLQLGPWYTSVDNIFTSYENVPNQDATFYTSLSPGIARTLYPNSLENMRNRVGSELGQDFNFRLYPKWMTSQQKDGSTLGYIPAWVICYTKPGFADIIKQNIETNWKDPVGYNLRLNEINFRLDRFTVDKSATYNYDTLLNPSEWTDLPSATPVPDPKDEYDFHVLYPRKTILPDQTQ
jgi:hypothetical protein